jgi:hypothetical protein
VAYLLVVGALGIVHGRPGRCSPAAPGRRVPGLAAVGNAPASPQPQCDPVHTGRDQAVDLGISGRHRGDVAQQRLRRGIGFKRLVSGRPEV